MPGRLAALLLFVIAALGLAVPAFADTRVALVIANADYKSVAKLPNPPNDARTMAAALRGVGFSVTEKANLGKRDLESALKTFAVSAREADVAVIYYAGHGMEQGGLNYLVPIDAALASDQDVEFDTVPLDLLLRSVEGASRMKLVILDACRNNPFLTTMRRAGGTRSVGRGLARVEPDSDILVAYAAREGSTADDGDGKDSPFTKALAQRIAAPGVEIRLLFGQVRDDVRKSTDNRQEPAIYGSLGGDPFYFVPPGGPATSVTSTGGETTPLKSEAERNAQLRMASVGELLGARSGGGGGASAGALAGAPPAGSSSGLLGSRSAFASKGGEGGETPFASGLAHIERQEWAAAVTDFDAILRLRPQNAGAWHNRARAKFGAGDVDGAIADVTRAIRLMPKNDQSYIIRARFYRLKLMWELALADSNTAVSLQPDAEAYYQRGLTYEGKGDAAAAAADYAKALSMNPRLPRVLLAQGRVMRRR